MQSLFSALIWASFSLTSQAFADTSLTMKQALDQAFDHSPILKSAEAKKDEARWHDREALTGFIPTVSLTGAHYVNKKYQLLDVNFNGNPVEIPQIFPTTSATASARWLLFDGFANVELKKKTSALADAARDHYEWTEFSLTREVRLAYAKVVAAKKLAEVSEQNVTTLQTHLEQVRNLQKGGLATHYDVLRVESQMSEAQAELLQAKDNIQINEEKLGATLGLNESVHASEMILENPNESRVKSLNYSAENSKRLDLSELNRASQAADYNDSATARFWIPKISLGADYIKYNNLSDGLSDWRNMRSAWDVGFFAQWDILNPRLLTQAEQEKYKSIQTAKSLQQATLQAPVEFAFWKKRYIYSASLYRAKKLDSERAEETVRLARAGFKAGVRTTAEVLDAELELFRAKAGIINAQMNCIEALNKLELSLGESL